jgi:hypothetical protein
LTTTLRVNGSIIERPFQVRRAMQDGYPSDRSYEIVIDDPIIGSFAVSDESFILELYDISQPEAGWRPTSISELLVLIYAGQRIQ